MLVVGKVVSQVGASELSHPGHPAAGGPVVQGKVRAVVGQVAGYDAREGAQARILCRAAFSYSHSLGRCLVQGGLANGTLLSARCRRCVAGVLEA